MATRLYLPASGSQAPLISPTPDASWESTGSLFRAIAHSVQTGTALATKSVAEATATTPYDVLLAQYISAPLNGDQTISGAIKGIIRAQEANADADYRAQLVIRVLSGDGSTVRGTLIASNTAALASEFATAALTNRKFPLGWTGSGETPTTVNALDGDRIVIEVGYRSHNSHTTSRLGSLSLGDPVGSDLAEDETSTTANAPWIEFADTLSFDVGAARVSQTAPEVLAAGTSSARLSQVAPEVLAVGTSNARLSQVVPEVLHLALNTARLSQVVTEVLMEAPTYPGGGERVQVFWVG